MADLALKYWGEFEDLTAQYIGYAWRQQDDQYERVDWPTLPMHELYWPIGGAVGYLLGTCILHV